MQEEVLNLYTAANKFVPDRLRHYARLYGFPNYKRATVECLHHAVGRCGNDNCIDIDFLYVLFADNTAFDTLLLHELCHTEFRNHEVYFWMLLNKTLKKVSIIGQNNDSRQQWLRLVVFNKDNLQTVLSKGRNKQCVNAFGGWHENVSAIKRGVIHRKICTDSLCNGCYVPILSQTRLVFL